MWNINIESIIPYLTFAADFPMGIRLCIVFELFAVSPLAFSCGPACFLRLIIFKVELDFLILCLCIFSFVTTAKNMFNLAQIYFKIVTFSNNLLCK